MQGERATSSPFAWRVRWVEETGSTNADLIEAARNGAPFGSVLVADHQSSGRGRLGRQWAAPPRSSLLCSMLLSPELAGGAPQRLTQAVALAAVVACGDVAGVDVSLKWPNDLLVGDRKLAGILAESVVTQGRSSAVVVGIGLNVNWPDELPAELAGLATALNHEAGRDVDRHALLDALLASTMATDWSALDAAYRARLATLGRDVRVDLGSVDVVGRAVDVTATGELVIEAEGGSRHVISAGDVVHLRGV